GAPQGSTGWAISSITCEPREVKRHCSPSAGRYSTSTLTSPNAWAGPTWAKTPGPPCGGWGRKGSYGKRDHHLRLRAGRAVYLQQTGHVSRVAVSAQGAGRPAGTGRLGGAWAARPGAGGGR